MLSDGLIGALIGGGATVLVSGITNYFVVRNLKKQQAHEAKQKSEDRKSAMRRDVYLVFIDEVQSLNAHLEDLHQLPLESQDKQHFHSFIRSSHKVQLIAESNTRALAKEHMDMLTQAFWAVVVASTHVRVATETQERIWARLTEAHGAADKVLNVLERGVQEGRHADEVARLSKALDVERALVQSLQAQHDQSRVELGKLQAQHFDLLRSREQDVDVLFESLVLSMREEIGLPATVGQ